MTENKNHRMNRIHQMLLEMASGNFFYRMERSAKNDNIEAISISLNMLAEEIQETMLHQGYANSNGTFMDIVQMSFILDENNVVQMTNQQTCTILSILHTDIIGKPFDFLLTESSMQKWKNIRKQIDQKTFYDKSFELTFKTKGNLVIPKVCYLSTFKNSEQEPRRTLITIIHHSNSLKELENDLKQRVIQFTNKEHETTKENPSKPQKPKLRLSFDDIRKIREGRNIIINNLEKELPSLRDFALQLGTNEFKLKYGFKELYGTTVYRFLLYERLRKSKMMIQYSDLPLKSIAHMVGFKSFPHFSRAFKKRYEYSPSELRKKTISKVK